MELQAIVTQNFIIYLPRLSAQIYRRLGVTLFHDEVLVIDPYLYTLLKGHVVQDRHVRKHTHLRQIKTHAFFGQQGKKTHWFNPKWISGVLLLALSCTQFASGELTDVNCTQIACTVIDDICKEQMLKEMECKGDLIDIKTFRHRLLDICLSPPMYFLKNAFRGPALYYHEIKNQTKWPIEDADEYKVFTQKNNTLQFVYTRDLKTLPEDIVKELNVTSEEHMKIKSMVNVNTQKMTPESRIRLSEAIMDDSLLGDDIIRQLWLGRLKRDDEIYLNLEYPGLLELASMARNVHMLEHADIMAHLEKLGGNAYKAIYEIEDMDVFSMAIDLFVKHLTISLSAKENDVHVQEIIVASLITGIVYRFMAFSGIAWKVKTFGGANIHKVFLGVAACVYTFKSYHDFTEALTISDALRATSHNNMVNGNLDEHVDHFDMSITFDILLKFIKASLVYMSDRNHDMRNMHIFDTMTFLLSIGILSVSSGAINKPLLKAFHVVTAGYGSGTIIVNLIKKRAHNQEGDDEREPQGLISNSAHNQEQATSEEQGDDLDSYDSSPDFNSGDELHSSDSEQPDDFDE